MTDYKRRFVSNNFIPYECWGMIKEFAGIYNIKGKWSKLIYVRNKQLHQFYTDLFDTHIGFKNTFKEKKYLLRRILSKMNTKQTIIELLDLIENNVRIGDRIFYKDNPGYIHKITPSCVVFKDYNPLVKKITIKNFKTPIDYIDNLDDDMISALILYFMPMN